MRIARISAAVEPTAAQVRTANSDIASIGVKTSAAGFLLDRAQRFQFRRLMFVGHNHCAAQAAFVVAHGKGATRKRESVGWEDVCLSRNGLHDIGKSGYEAQLPAD